VTYLPVQLEKDQACLCLTQLKRGSQLAEHYPRNQYITNKKTNCIAMSLRQRAVAEADAAAQKRMNGSVTQSLRELSSTGEDLMLVRQQLYDELTQRYPVNIGKAVSKKQRYVSIELLLLLGSLETCICSGNLHICLIGLVWCFALGGTLSVSSLLLQSVVLYVGHPLRFLVTCQHIRQLLYNWIRKYNTFTFQCTNE
jgi:hypothetical protein